MFYFFVLKAPSVLHTAETHCASSLMCRQAFEPGGALHLRDLTRATVFANIIIQYYTLCRELRILFLFCVCVFAQ